MAQRVNTFVGAGVAYRHRYRDALLGPLAQRPWVLEVMAEHFFAQPDALLAVAEAYPLVFHDVGLSAGTCGLDDGPTLARIRALADAAKPLMFTEHASLSCSPEGVSLGHLAPLWYTEQALGLLADKLRRWQDTLRLPVALETITAPFTIPHADMDEATFLHRLTDLTGCGLLLDLTNLWINAQNHHFDPLTRLREYPLSCVWAVHLSGGQQAPDHWIDSHDAPVSSQSFALLEALRILGAPALQTITIERDGRWPPLADLCAEAAHAHAIWTTP